MTFGTHKADFLLNLVPKNNNWHLGKLYVHPKLFSVPVANEIHKRIFLPFHSAFTAEVCLATELVFLFYFILNMVCKSALISCCLSHLSKHVSLSLLTRKDEYKHCSPFKRDVAWVEAEML